MKVELTEPEHTTLINALQMAITSAQRAQKSGKTPQISEVFRKHEEFLKTLELKLSAAK